MEAKAELERLSSTAEGRPLPPPPDDLLPPPPDDDLEPPPPPEPEPAGPEAKGRRVNGEARRWDVAAHPERIGMTNGLRTSQVGLTNGLTNGLRGRTTGAPEGLQSSARRRGSMYRGRQAALASLAIVALLATAFLFLPDDRSAHALLIDGDVSDWNPASIAAQSLGSTANPNVDIVRLGVTDNFDHLAFAVEVKGSVLRGGDAPPTVDVFRIFLDTDTDASTGYAVGGLGADRMLEVSGWRGAVNASLLQTWDRTRDAYDWRGWVPAAAVEAAAKGPRIEVQVEWSSLVDTKRPVFAAVHARAHDGTVDTGDFVLTSAGASLVVGQVSVVSETITGTSAPLLRLEFVAPRMQARLRGITAGLVGSGVSHATSVRLLDNNVTIAQTTAVGGRVAFRFAEREVLPGAPLWLTVVADVNATGGETLGALVQDPGDVDAPDAAVTVRRVRSTRDLGYLGSPPVGPKVDGGFSEWIFVSADPLGDVSDGNSEDIDLENFAADAWNNRSFFYAQVGGRVLAGTWVPERNGPESRVPARAADHDRDGVPTDVDPLPFDFDNDGTADAQSAGDFDGDGLTDYGFAGGEDMWLNTTIPNSFPAPYAGRLVNLYIGPVERPYHSREDNLRVFLDLDDSAATGYAVAGIGADRMIETSGIDGLLRAAGDFAFAGRSPGEWSWTRRANVTAAVGVDRIEFASDAALDVGGARMHVEIGDALGAQDTWSPFGQRSPMRSGSNSGPAYDPNPPQPMDIPGNLPFWLRDTDHSTETACTLNKVATTTQGSGPLQTATLNPGEDACWYLDATSGATIPAGDWEALLDLTTPTGPSNGLVAYGEGTATAQRYRLWNGTAFGVEASGQSMASRIQWVVVEASPTARDEKLMGALISTNRLYVQTWDGGAWTSNWNVDLGGSSTRRFDIAYEGDSGDAIVVFGDGTSQLKYRKRVGGTWDATNQNAGTPLTELPLWVNAESRPTNDDVFVAVVSNTPRLHAMRWNGTSNAWANQVLMTGVPTDKSVENVDVSFERASGDAFVLWGDTSAQLRVREFTTSWQAEVNAYSGMPDDAIWVAAAYDRRPTSSSIAVGMVLNNGDFEWGAWDGAAWVARPPAIAARNKAQRGIDVAFEMDTGTAVYVFARNANPTQLSWRTWTAAGGFSASTSESGSTANINYMQLRADPSNNELMALYADANADLFHRLWKGGSWSALGTALETSLSEHDQREAFMFAWDSSPTVEYSIYLEIWNKDTDTVAEEIGSCLDWSAVGDDVQCYVPGIFPKFLSANQVVRIRVVHSSASGTVAVAYEDSDSSGDSRATIPIPIGIPEFPLAAVGLALGFVVIGLGRRFRPTRDDRRRGSPRGRRSVF